MTNDTFNPEALPAVCRMGLLKRYEWLADFIMAAPGCAAQHEQRELSRRIEQLRASLATPDTEVSEMVPGGQYETDDSGIPF